MLCLHRKLHCAHVRFPHHAPPPGGYTFYITAHGDKGHANELRALPDGQDSGYFVLFFRIYQDHADAPPHPDVDPSACFGPTGRHPRETPQEWGWACPPEVSINRGGAGFRALPFCRYRRKYGIRYHGAWVAVGPAFPCVESDDDENNSTRPPLHTHTHTQT